MNLGKEKIHRENKFDLVLTISRRAKKIISNEKRPHTKIFKNKPVVTAIREMSRYYDIREVEDFL